LPVMSVRDNLVEILNEILTVNICTLFIWPGLHYEI